MKGGRLLSLSLKSERSPKYLIFWVFVQKLRLHFSVIFEGKSPKNAQKKRRRGRDIKKVIGISDLNHPRP